MSKNWKEIFGFNGFYEVSEDGQIRSTDRIISKANGRLERRLGRTIRQSTDRYGYKTVCLCINGIEKTMKVHRIVAIAFIDKVVGADFINHKDGDKKNNNVSNLEWVTSKQNTVHAIATGLAATGERHKNSKPVINAKTGEKYVSIAEASKKMNISHSTLKSDIRRGNNIYTINQSEWPK